MQTETQSPITQYVEYGRKVFGDPRRRKRLERFDVYLADVDGPVTITAYWRADNDSKWREWDSQSVCAKTTDASVVDPHVFKLLNKQQRPQIKTFTIPTQWNTTTGYQAHIGFEFQLRLKIVGNARVYRALVQAETLPIDSSFHGDVATTCVEDDSSRNAITYKLQPTAPGGMSVYQGATLLSNGATVDYGVLPYGSLSKTFTIKNTVGSAVAVSSISTGSSAYSYSGPALPLSIAKDGESDFAVISTPTGTLTQDMVITSDSATPEFTVHLTTTGLSADKALWFDASRQTGFTEGASIDSLTDFSGNNRTATPSTGPRAAYRTNRVNGLPSFRFPDGSSCRYSSSEINYTTGDLYIVGRVNATSILVNFKGICIAVNNNNFTLKTSDSVSTSWNKALWTGGITYHMDGVDLTATGAAGYGAVHVYRLASVTPITLQLWFGQANSQAPDWDMCELISFNNKLSNSESAVVQSYLKSKWGTP